MKKPTIKEVAKKANVSSATVSYVLNKKKKVSKDTYERVMQAVDDLDYNTNFSAQNLRSTRRDIVLVLVDNISGEFYHEFIEGISEKLTECNLKMIITSEETVNSIGLDIFCGIINLRRVISRQTIKLMENSDLPIVTIEKMAGTFDYITEVFVNNYKGCEELLNVMPKVDLVYLVTGPSNSHDSIERLDYCEDYLIKNKIPYQILQGQFSRKETEKMEIPDLSNRKTAFICFNDQMALGIYPKIKKQKLKVGQDVYVSGFDNSYYASFASPTMTSVGVKTKDWGNQTVLSLVDMIKQKEAGCTSIKDHVEMNLKLYRRKSF